MEIGLCWFWKYFTVRNFVTLICSLLTIYLTYQEMYTFLIIKPTGTAKEEKQLKTADLPEVVVCMDPPIDLNELRQYGYDSHYYRGSIDGDKFVGWNGDENENKSSFDILEDVLVVNMDFRSVLRSAKFRRENFEKVGADIKLRTLAYPHSRCLSIGPPKESFNDTDINSLMLTLNETYIQEHNFLTFHLRIYFMDKINSLQLYPNEMEMRGDRVKIEMHGEKSLLSFKSQISRYVHTPGDPLLDCAVYTEENSYSNCIRKELDDTFMQKIGCVPPLIETDTNKMCNKKFNVSRKIDQDMSTIFKSLYHHNRKYKCRNPCTRNIYRSSFVHESPKRKRSLVVVFDKTIDMVNSLFNIDGQTLLTRLGGSVSSGRTLLWIILTLFATSQVSKLYKVVQVENIPQMMPSMFCRLRNCCPKERKNKAGTKYMFYCIFSGYI